MADNNKEELCDICKHKNDTKFCMKCLKEDGELANFEEIEKVYHNYSVLFDKDVYNLKISDEKYCEIEEFARELHSHLPCKLGPSAYHITMALVYMHLFKLNFELCDKQGFKFILEENIKPNNPCTNLFRVKEE